MPAPQVNERSQDAPAGALRALFAGIGRLLSTIDKLRSKPASNAPAGARSTTTASRPETSAPEASASKTAGTQADTSQAPAAAAGPATTTPAPGPGSGTSAAKPAAAAKPEAAAKPAAQAKPAAAGEHAGLPLANYDELTVASLRARLRNLTAAQLGQLIEYEKGHANRAEVVAMFERRVAKLESEG